MNKQQQLNLWYVFVAVMGVIIFAQLWSAGQNVVTIPYSQFLADLNSGKIADVRVSGRRIQGEWKEPQKNGIKELRDHPGRA